MIPTTKKGIYYLRKVEEYGQTDFKDTEDRVERNRWALRMFFGPSRSFVILMIVNCLLLISGPLTPEVSKAKLPLEILI